MWSSRPRLAARGAEAVLEAVECGGCRGGGARDSVVPPCHQDRGVAGGHRACQATNPASGIGSWFVIQWCHPGASAVTRRIPHSSKDTGLPKKMCEL